GAGHSRKRGNGAGPSRKGVFSTAFRATVSPSVAGSQRINAQGRRRPPNCTRFRGESGGQRKGGPPCCRMCCDVTFWACVLLKVALAPPRPRLHRQDGVDGGGIRARPVIRASFGRSRAVGDATMTSRALSESA